MAVAALWAGVGRVYRQHVYTVLASASWRTQTTTSKLFYLSYRHYNYPCNINVIKNMKTRKNNTTMVTIANHHHAHESVRTSQPERSRCCRHPWFTSEETEAERGLEIFPESHRSEVENSALEPRTQVLSPHPEPRLGHSSFRAFLPACGDQPVLSSTCPSLLFSVCRVLLVYSMELT